MQHLKEIIVQAVEAVANATDLATLDTVRVEYLGKKGILTEQMKTLGKLPPAEKPKAGQAINLAKQEIQKVINDKRDALQKAV